MVLEELGVWLALSLFVCPLSPLEGPRAAMEPKTKTIEHESVHVRLFGSLVAWQSPGPGFVGDTASSTAALLQQE